ncbi:MAG: alanine:cation symporter family protein, partial [Christensenellaceae bacterium]|nr:alanine:cation symporter family protein [Christensenellaceae bacterium]
SNEAGMGTAPIAAAAAKTDDAAHQGLVMMMGTFIDTVVMCMMTGLVIVMAGSWKPELGMEGVDITVLAFQRLMPFSPRISSFMVMLSLVIFAFTTIIGWNYYAERCFAYLTDERSVLMKIYRAAYAAAVFVGPYLTVGTVWMIADIFNGLMVLPNMIALFALSGTAAKLTADFYRKQKRTDLQ